MTSFVCNTCWVAVLFPGYKSLTVPLDATDAETGTSSAGDASGQQCQARVCGERYLRVLRTYYWQILILVYVCKIVYPLYIVY